MDWWETATKASYLKKAKCIIEQYGNYTIPELGLSLNGINTQGENIADNGGIKEAYRAYSEYNQNCFLVYKTKNNYDIYSTLSTMMSLGVRSKECLEYISTLGS